MEEAAGRAIVHFGRVFGMEMQEIENRSQFLTDHENLIVHNGSR
jgi:hypothetical protein